MPLRLCRSASAFLVLASSALAADGPSGRWSFEALDGAVGNAWAVPGVLGQALQLDGIGAHLVSPASRVPVLSGSFTLEGWVALSVRRTSAGGAAAGQTR